MKERRQGCCLHCLNLLLSLAHMGPLWMDPTHLAIKANILHVKQNHCSYFWDLETGYCDWVLWFLACWQLWWEAAVRLAAISGNQHCGLDSLPGADQRDCQQERLYVSWLSQLLTASSITTPTQTTSYTLLEIGNQKTVFVLFVLQILFLPPTSDLFISQWQELWWCTAVAEMFSCLNPVLRVRF